VLLSIALPRDHAKSLSVSLSAWQWVSRDQNRKRGGLEPEDNFGSQTGPKLENCGAVEREKCVSPGSHGDPVCQHRTPCIKNAEWQRDSDIHWCVTPPKCLNSASLWTELHPRKAQVIRSWQRSSADGSKTTCTYLRWLTTLPGLVYRSRARR
jgi:hypothetical protein